LAEYSSFTNGSQQQRRWRCVTIASTN
jgi:hypothetical protein